MTRPPQPQPYPGDEGYARVVPTGPARLYREFKDLRGRPLVGVAHVRNERYQSVDLDVEDGVLDAELPQGQYRLLAVLTDPDGKYHYATEDVTL